MSLPSGGNGGVEGDVDTDLAPADGNETGASGNMSASGNTTTDPSPTPTPTEPSGPNQTKLEASLEANVTNGTAPLNVSFTLDAFGESGGDLSWTFDADGDGAADMNGTDLPATVNVTFNETGNHTVVLDITEGAETAQANRTIEVVEEVVPAMCHRQYDGKINEYYIDDRGDPSGTGIITGGGIWIYRESNGVDGLQVGHPEDEQQRYRDCENPDTLIY